MEKNLINTPEIHGMVLLKEEKPFNISAFLQMLADYDLQIDEVETSEDGIVFEISGDKFLVFYVDFPIPEGDIKYAAGLTDNWRGAWEELKDHQAHVIISGLNGKLNQTERFITLTKLILTLLHTTSCMGVYMGNQGLIISVNRYLEAEKYIREDRFPLEHWINICIFTHHGKNYIRTLGLTEFGMMEIDMIDSHDFQDMYLFVCGVLLYILENQIIIKVDTNLTMDGSRVAFEQAISPLDDSKVLRILS